MHYNGILDGIFSYVAEEHYKIVPGKSFCPSIFFSFSLLEVILFLFEERTIWLKVEMNLSLFTKENVSFKRERESIECLLAIDFPSSKVYYCPKIYQSELRNLIPSTEAIVYLWQSLFCPLCWQP